MSDERIAELVTLLAVWCEECGHAIDAAGRVAEPVAAEILARSPRTLANWRSSGEGPAFYRGSPVAYALRDLAAFIERQRTNLHDSSRIYVAAAAAVRDRRG